MLRIALALCLCLAAVSAQVALICDVTDKQYSGEATVFGETIKVSAAFIGGTAPPYDAAVLVTLPGCKPLLLEGTWTETASSSDNQSVSIFLSDCTYTGSAQQDPGCGCTGQEGGGYNAVLNCDTGGKAELTLAGGLVTAVLTEGAAGLVASLAVILMAAFFLLAL